MTPEQAEEVDALLAIFPDDCTLSGETCTLQLLYGETGRAAVRFTLGPGYPSSSAPALEVSGLPRGQGDALLPRLYALSAAHEGEPHLYQLVEVVRSWLGLDDVPPPPPEPAALGEGEGVRPASGLVIAHGVPGCGVAVDRKSVFQAHVAPVHSREGVAAALSDLLCDGKVARATHNISAFRFFHAPTSTWTCEGDDDGEDGAAYKLAVMMGHMQVQNVLVVVTRWYGGVHLGPSRFHHINTCAKQLLEREGYGAKR